MRRLQTDWFTQKGQRRIVFILMIAMAAVLFVCDWHASYGSSASSSPAPAPGSSCNCPLCDWPSIERFQNANRWALQQSPSTRTVVFLGDSITEHWIIQRPSFFSSHGFVNRGIYGQTTPQVLLRLRPDVIALSPKVVVILAGTNDLAGNTGTESLPYIEGNLASMVEIAKANNIRAVLSSILPVNDVYKPRTTTRKPDDILKLNRWMSQLCASGSCVYLDYFNHMIDRQGYLRRELTDDGIHPNPMGYAVMEPLAKIAIQRAMHP